MAQDSCLNGCSVGRRKRYIIGHTGEDCIGNALACNIMGYTRFVLFIFADIVKKCRGIDDLTVKFEPFLKILDPHNAGDVQQVVNAVTTKNATRFQLSDIAQMTSEQTIGTDVIDSRHGAKRSQARSHKTATRRSLVGVRYKVVDDSHANGPAS